MVYATIWRWPDQLIPTKWGNTGKKVPVFDTPVHLTRPCLKRFRIRDMDGLSVGIGQNLIEDHIEECFQSAAFHVTQMRSAYDIVHGEQRVLTAHDRLMLVDIHRR